MRFLIGANVVCLRYEAFFLHSSKSASRDLEFDFFTVNDDRFFLKIWLPDFVCLALRKAYVVTKLLSFAGDFTLFHSTYILISYWFTEVQ